MASKCLYDEMLEDLQQVVSLDRGVAPSALERAVLTRLLLVEPWYGTGSVLEDPEVLRRTAVVLATNPLWQRSLLRSLAHNAAAAVCRRSGAQASLSRLWKAFAGLHLRLDRTAP